MKEEESRTRQARQGHVIKTAGAAAAAARASMHSILARHRKNVEVGNFSRFSPHKKETKREREKNKFSASSFVLYGLAMHITTSYVHVHSSQTDIYSYSWQYVYSTYSRSNGRRKKRESCVFILTLFILLFFSPSIFSPFFFLSFFSALSLSLSIHTVTTIQVGILKTAADKRNS